MSKSNIALLVLVLFQVFGSLSFAKDEGGGRRSTQRPPNLSIDAAVRRASERSPESLVGAFEFHLNTINGYFATHASSKVEKENTYAHFVSGLNSFRRHSGAQDFFAKVRKNRELGIRMVNVFDEAWSKSLQYSSSYEAFLNRLNEYSLFMLTNHPSVPSDGPERYERLLGVISQRWMEYFRLNSDKVPKTKTLVDVCEDLVRQTIFASTHSSETLTDRQLSQAALNLILLQKADPERYSALLTIMNSNMNALRPGAEKLLGHLSPRHEKNSRPSKLWQVVQSCFGVFSNL